MGPFIWIRMKLSQETDGCIAAKGKSIFLLCLCEQTHAEREGNYGQTARPSVTAVHRRLFGQRGFRCGFFFVFFCVHALDGSLGRVGSAAAASSSEFLLMPLGTSIIFSKKTAGRHLMPPRASS